MTPRAWPIRTSGAWLVGFMQETAKHCYILNIIYKLWVSWLTLLYTKYITCGPYGFREEDFLSFSLYKSIGANDPRGVASLDPRGMIGRIYVGDL